MPQAVMLFAAGFGTRMGPLTKDRPKPLIKVAGKPLLDHALAQTKGIPRRVVNAHYKADQIVDHLAGTDVTVSIETPDVLDTGGGLRQALPLLGNGPVFTMNTDAVWAGPRAMQVLQDAWRPDDMDALLLVVPQARAVGRKTAGDFSQDSAGRLHRKGDLVYTGAQILRTDGLKDIADQVFSLNLLWNKIAEQGRLFGVVYSGHWADVGHPQGIELAEDMLASFRSEPV